MSPYMSALGIMLSLASREIVTSDSVLTFISFRPRQDGGLTTASASSNARAVQP